MILMIDNYDSFTYNIVQYLGELGSNVKVVRNDMISIQDIQYMEPCTPKEAGLSIETINHFHKKLPILGICLGHQSIGAAFGGNIIKAKKIMHGKTSQIHHNQDYIFKDLPTPYIATRYHSLVIEEKTIPDCLEIIAETKSDDKSDNEIMAIRHKDFHTYGVQFHPEYKSTVTNPQPLFVGFVAATINYSKSKK